MATFPSDPPSPRTPRGGPGRNIPPVAAPPAAEPAAQVLPADAELAADVTPADVTPADVAPAAGPPGRWSPPGAGWVPAPPLSAGPEETAVIAAAVELAWPRSRAVGASGHRPGPGRRGAGATSRPAASGWPARPSMVWWASGLWWSGAPQQRRDRPSR
ncbi:MAG TPA: hypothetical protein VMD59_08145 [Acidimicrobiales bacterium]|nr:hypothetical protein [Acidimicrobiales bacterium]